MLGALRQRRLSVVCVIMAAAASVALTAPRVAEGASWASQSVPAPTASNGAFSAVSCPTATACEAAGYSLTRSGRQRMLAGAWNGTSWTVQSPTAPTGATKSILEGISCTAATTCTAVGGYGTTGSSLSMPLAESLSGTTWTTQAVPTPSSGAFATLAGVSCISASSCTAVGEYLNTVSNQSVPFAAHWDGTSWTDQSMPVAAGATATGLYSVTCTSANACIATGGYATTGGAGSPNNVLVETWNGTSWAVQTAPTPTGATAAALTNVSCTASNACTAVGGYATSGPLPNKTLAERWNGTSWTVQTTPNPSSGSAMFTGVSCTGADCFAVGAPTTHSAVAEEWNGTSWSMQTAPKPSGSSFSGVSCTSTTACMLVGARNFQFQVPPLTLSETWNGSSWTTQKTPNTSGAAASQLMGVSCTAGPWCSAVGTYFATGGHQHSLAEGWDGTKWTLETTPMPTGASGVQLNGVSCTSSTACLAVGQTSLGTFAEQWSAAGWAYQTPPNPASSYGAVLSAVSCTPATSCVAVGSYNDSVTGHHLTLAEQLSGTTWTVLTTANPAGTTYGTLTGVSCTAVNACIAVGGYSTAANAFQPAQPLIETWNGVNWTIQTPPAPVGTTAASLSGVSCSDAADCTAVGGYTTAAGSSPNQTLAERWNGTNWAVQTTPNPTPFSTFSADSCAGASACTAVGNFFAEGWNGTSWGNQTLRNPTTGSGQASGVSCTAAAICTADGTINSFYVLTQIFATSYYDSQLSLPLAEHYS
jgi:hypothetical protein